MIDHNSDLRIIIIMIILIICCVNDGVDYIKLVKILGIPKEFQNFLLLSSYESYNCVFIIPKYEI
jgi:hypothetical protein